MSLWGVAVASLCPLPRWCHSCPQVAVAPLSPCPHAVWHCHRCPHTVRGLHPCPHVTTLHTSATPCPHTPWHCHPVPVSLCRAVMPLPCPQWCHLHPRILMPCGTATRVPSEPWRQSCPQPGADATPVPVSLQYVAVPPVLPCPPCPGVGDSRVPVSPAWSRWWPPAPGRRPSASCRSMGRA